MSNTAASLSLAEARRYASAAAFDIQKLPEDTVERSALHNLQDSIDMLIQALDAVVENTE